MLKSRYDITSEKLVWYIEKPNEWNEILCFIELASCSLRSSSMATSYMHGKTRRPIMLWQLGFLWIIQSICSKKQCGLCLRFLINFHETGKCTEGSSKMIL